ncbi:hypothetical protein EJB05_28895, partial [Eragrostis curvula]
MEGGCLGQPAQAISGCLVLQPASLGGNSLMPAVAGFAMSHELRRKGPCWGWVGVEVTRFLYNDGFAIGYRFCHNITDAFGMVQLFNDVYGLVRGEKLTQLPVWEMDLLTARAPGSMTHKHTA